MPPILGAAVGGWFAATAGMSMLWAAGDATGPVVGGAFGLLALLATYLLRELNRSSGGAWRVVREKNREIHRLRWESSYWQFQAGMGPDPGLYQDPPDSELKTW